MASFSVKVHQIKKGSVTDHPGADRLSLVKIDGYTCISAKVDGNHRYKAGDLVVYVPEGAVVPENLLRMGFWNEEQGKGILAGAAGNRVKAMKIRSVYSQGILFPVGFRAGQHVSSYFVETATDTIEIAFGSANTLPDVVGVDVADLLGIFKYEAPIPVGMNGVVTGCVAVKAFDFNSIQSEPDLFTPGEAVVATEKIHGTFFQCGIIPGMNDPRMFGDGSVYVTSKGLAEKGLAFLNVENSRKIRFQRWLRRSTLGAKILRWFGVKKETKSIYVATLERLLKDGLLDRIDEHCKAAMPLRIFGEIYGKGVQDLHYGTTTSEFRVFDIMCGDEFIDPDNIERVATLFGLAVVPELYKGPYDLQALEKVRDGKDTLSGTHVREGIVIRAKGSRKIAKWVSPAYSLRKGEVTEFQ
jgi:RNA ligase (TIGR02306 family)